MPEGFLGKLQSASGKDADWKTVEEGGRILTLVPTVYQQEYTELSECAGRWLGYGRRDVEMENSVTITAVPPGVRTVVEY